jgi:hypothetical protein
MTMRLSIKEYKKLEDIQNKLADNTATNND